MAVSKRSSRHLLRLAISLGAWRCTLAGTLPIFDAVSAEAGVALRSSGAVLLRGQTFSADDLRQTAIAAWNAAGYDYDLGDYNRGGSVQRPEMRKNVYDVAAGAPAEKPVGVHCEKSYQAQIPHFVAFGCLREADTGGELQLVDNVRLKAELSPELLGKLRDLGVEYSRRLGDEVLTPNWTYPTGFWQQRFGTEDWAEAQRAARKDTTLGGKAGTRLERSQDGTVLLRWRAAALGTTNDGEEALVNGILDNHNSSNYGLGISPLHATWGDGSEFYASEIEEFRAAYRAAEWASVKLRAGEAIVVDNFKLGHGRVAYRGKRVHVQLMSEQVARGLEVPIPFKTPEEHVDSNSSALTYRRLADITPPETDMVSEAFDRIASPSQQAERMLSMLKSLQGMNLGAQVDLYEHSLQTATRSLRDGADNETVVVALLHDLGELIAPTSHGEMVAGMLRPYISPANYWTLMHHEIFQAYYYGPGYNLPLFARNARDAFRASEHFNATEAFCLRWDQAAFDPDYESLPLEVFEPMVHEIMSRTPYAHPKHGLDPVNAGKKLLLSAYPSHVQVESSSAGEEMQSGPRSAHM